MTALRRSAILELEKIPEDKLSFVIQIMQGVNGLYNETDKEREKRLNDWNSYEKRVLLQMIRQS